MTPRTTLQHRALPLLLAAIASLSLLAGCDRRAADPNAPATGGATAPSAPPAAETVPGTTPGAMPPASGASG